MGERAILTFNKNGYDPFIDFLKAYSIVMVVVAHILPPASYKYILFWVWGDMQVPMFVLIQVFHAYKKDRRPTLKWSSLIKRIIIPFVIIQALILGFKVLVSNEIPRFMLVSGLLGGGFGPGSYYIWIYLQIAVLLVVIWPWLKMLSLNQAIISFLFISVVFEILFSVSNCPEALYRVLCARYLFLIPLGLIWVEKGVVLNRGTILLSILSIIAVLFFVLTDYNLEPLFFNTRWRFHRWICYFYLPSLLTYVLYLVWVSVRRITWVESLVRWIAARSYEVFLAQMAVIACIKTLSPSIVSNRVIAFVLFAIIVFAFSFSLGGFVFWFEKKILKW